MYNIVVENKENTKKLIESKWIDFNVEDSDGLTAYGYARHRSYNDLMKIIEEKEKSNIKMEKN